MSDPEPAKPQMDDQVEPEQGATTDAVAPAGGTVEDEQFTTNADRAANYGLLAYVAVVAGAFFQAKLPDGIREGLYEASEGKRAVGIAAVLALVFAVGLVRQLGEDKIREIWAFLRRLGPAAILGGLWAALPAIAGILLLTNLGTVSEWLVGEGDPSQSRIAMAVLVFVSVFIISAGCGLLPTFSQAILAGYAFGVPIGFVAALAGFGGASMVGFFLSKKIAKERVEREIVSHPKALLVREALVHGGFWKTLALVTLVRVPPNSPFALTNLVLTATDVSKRVYLLGTLIGMAPRTLAAVIVGSHVTNLADIDKPKWLVFGGIALTVLVIVVIGSLANKALHKVANGGSLESV